MSEDPYKDCPEHYTLFGLSEVGLQAHKDYHDLIRESKELLLPNVDYPIDKRELSTE